VRRMALDEATTAVLMAQRDFSEQRCAAVGTGLDADALVWSRALDYSEPLKPGRTTAEFSKLRGELGLRNVRLHYLQHFAATVMLAGGDVRNAAGRLGSCSPTLSLQTYAHVLDVTDREAAAILERTISARDAEAQEDLRGSTALSAGAMSQDAGRSAAIRCRARSR